MAGLDLAGPGYPRDTAHALPRREGDGHPSALRDAEWARLEPLIPGATPGWRPQDRHADGDERDFLPPAHGLPVALPPTRWFPPRSTVYNIFRKFQREGVWEAIWAELHIALQERMGREASPSAAVLDSQSVRSAEKKGRQR
jgi:transposase